MVDQKDGLKSQVVYDYIAGRKDEILARSGNKLPTEDQLALLIGTDRFTVRRALRRLAEDGEIHSIRNRGYFFRMDRVRVPVAGKSSYHQFCESQGIVPRMEILDVREELPSPEVCEALGLAADRMVWNIHILRYQNDLPFCITRSWLPRDLTPGLLRGLLETPSLYKVLGEAYGIVPRRIRTVCAALNASREEARLLDLPLSFALLKASSTAVDQAGNPIEYCESSYRGDIISLSFEIQGHAP